MRRRGFLAAMVSATAGCSSPLASEGKYGLSPCEEHHEIRVLNAEFELRTTRSEGEHDFTAVVSGRVRNIGSTPQQIRIHALMINRHPSRRSDYVSLPKLRSPEFRVAPAEEATFEATGSTEYRDDPDAIELQVASADACAQSWGLF